MSAKPFLALAGTAAFSAILAGSMQVNAPVDREGFPLSVWKEQKQVTQIPWLPLVGEATMRGDLRQEFYLGATVRAEDVETLDKPDLILFARVLERGQAITPIHSVVPRQPKGDAAAFAALKEGATQPVSLSMYALVRPGKYKLELALLDRTSGRYSVRFEDVTVEGNTNDPVEKAFQRFSKFEFVPESIPKERGRTGNIPLPERMAGDIVGALRGFTLIRPPVLTAPSRASTTEKPTFIVERPGTTHVSVIAILNPPEAALRDARLLDLFQLNMSHLLAVFARLDSPNGTARFTGLDLAERTRPLEGIELKEITPELLDTTLQRDTRTVSLNTLSQESSQGSFLRDVLRDQLQAAERDASGARHAIIVVSAHSGFPDASSLAIPSPRDCHCQVFYVRFALVPNEPDHIDDMLKAYKPQVFDPLTWREFRQDFGKIYAQLLR